MKLYTKWTSTAATTEGVCKIPNIKKISNEHFNLCEAGISMHFSNELAPVLLGVYDSWRKFDSMDVTTRGIIFAIRTLSRTNYLQKTERRPKRKAPK